MKRLPTTLTNVSRRSRLLGAACALVVLGLAGGNPSAASTPIYKCLDRNLGIVYTDLPCKDGERMDLRAGDADPVAVARLDREREALDRSSALRIVDERRASLTRQYSPAPYDAPVEDDASYADGPDYYGYGYGALAYAPQGRHRNPDGRPDRRSTRQSVVPSRMSLPSR